MTTCKHIAKHFRELYFGGNWTCSSIQQQVNDISWEHAQKSVNGLNSIATLVFHMHYYTKAITEVLKGNPLNAKDEWSFNNPNIKSENDWKTFLDTMWTEAETFAKLVEKLPDTTLDNYFTEEKYGVYYRNLHGLIEHGHYHLGQISLIKKIITK